MDIKRPIIWSKIRHRVDKMTSEVTEKTAHSRNSEAEG